MSDKTPLQIIKSINEYALSGEMLSVDYVLTHSELISKSTPEKFELILKNDLCNALAQKMMESNCIEFTKQTMHNTDTTVYRARVFVTTSDVVKMIRENKIIVA